MVVYPNKKKYNKVDVYVAAFVKERHIQGGYYTRCFKRGYLVLKLNFAALNVSMKKLRYLEFRDL